MFTNKKVTVVGSGISGIAAARLLLHKNAKVVLYDSNESLDKEKVLERIGETITVICGEFTEELAEQTELLVLSPGVPTDLPFVLKLKERGIPVWGEIELAYQVAGGKFIGITGTNGKTTTTALTGEIMKQWFPDVYVVGNIGIPYTEMAEQITDTSVTVAELSSFQLETVQDDFIPDVSMILNLTPDHLNRHYTMENYARAKLNVAKNQKADQTCILNYEDAMLREYAKELSCRILWFSSRQKLETGLYLDGNSILYAEEGNCTEICKTEELNIIGLHNYENAMAAIGAALCMEVPLSAIRQGLISFHAVEHRIEFVATKRGVDYYNDSKGTNPDAAIKGIQAMSKPTLLIGGGYDKNSEYEEWIAAFEGKVKYLVLIGQTKEKIAETAKKMGMEAVVLMDSFEEAMEFCVSHAEPGDAVLLSPACASWGMFKNYEERGCMFKDYVKGIEE
ncbi:MAG: UDP-N-acetylmuramoyl-L-alanine--D-glutamate ligase [Lachnospiraceae bacterium]|nr:UDP-N-acetylmuramoyl-L-alanine--D-glutamate ligase [Lachnospiraceae bacterium]MBP3567859.1 UDP-N-acetylmuramoyl-L-alanine--D-glutamate ligase [Lachnospiraceae bacterium]